MSAPASVLLIGWARSTQAAAALLDHLKQDYFIYDDKVLDHPRYVNQLEVFQLSFSEALLSPGFPRSHSFVKELLMREVPLYTEMDFAGRFLEDEVIVGVTASVGKSSFCSYLKQLLEKKKQSVFLGGNFGLPLCSYVLQKKLNPQKKCSYLILELSSYQLETLKLEMHFGILLNLYPNHLDRYESKKHYYETKFNILDRISNRLHVLSEGGDLKSFRKDEKLKNRCLWYEFSEKEFEQLESSQLWGKANKNYLLLLQGFISKELGVSISSEDLLSLKALEHRLEEFEANSRRSIFVNDSKSTSVEGIDYALETVRQKFPQKKICLLMGGQDKDLDFSTLSQWFPSIQCRVFGALSEALKKEFKLEESFCYRSLKELLECEKFDAENTLYLLSPGGSSLDEFKSFEERGSFFKEKVRLKIKAL